MKRIIICVSIASLLAITILAQEKPKADPPTAETKATAATSTEAFPSVDEIIDKHTKALGGKEAIEKITSQTFKGTFEIEAMSVSAEYESYRKAPNKVATFTTVPNFATFSNVFDGTKAWIVNPMEGGLRELSGAELSGVVLDSDFHRELNFKKNYPKMSVKGKEKGSSNDTYVIEATSSDGIPEKFYFDVSTGLLVRHDAERDSPQGKFTRELHFDDYKIIDGVKVAHTIKLVTPGFAAVIKYVEVKQNVPIDDVKFNKPAEK
jgi:zinc protease